MSAFNDQSLNMPRFTYLNRSLSRFTRVTNLSTATYWANVAKLRYDTCRYMSISTYFVMDRYLSRFTRVTTLRTAAYSVDVA